eukprot:1659711-Pyramimonas_sp.AAC.1
MSKECRNSVETVSDESPRARHVKTLEFRYFWCSKFFLVIKAKNWLEHQEPRIESINRVGDRNEQDRQQSREESNRQKSAGS